MKNTAGVMNHETSKHTFINKSLSSAVVEITIQIKHHLFYVSLPETAAGKTRAGLRNQYL